MVTDAPEAQAIGKLTPNHPQNRSETANQTHPLARRAAAVDITSTIYDTITATVTLVVLEEGDATTEYGTPPPPALLSTHNVIQKNELTPPSPQTSTPQQKHTTPPRKPSATPRRP